MRQPFQPYPFHPSSGSALAQVSRPLTVPYGILDYLTIPYHDIPDRCHTAPTSSTGKPRLEARRHSSAPSKRVRLEATIFVILDLVQQPIRPYLHVVCMHISVPAGLNAHRPLATYQSFPHSVKGYSLRELVPLPTQIMTSLNTSTNGASISRSYKFIVDAPPPSGPAASSPTYGQWAVFAVSAPLANAFQQDSGKESVLKVQSTGGKLLAGGTGC